MTAVDLNSDMGEAFGAWRMGEDAALLDIVTSANVACGLHAGDPEIMAATFRLAREKGVSVGAHPGFPDLQGFGRRAMPLSAGEIERTVAYQIGAAQGLSAWAGHPISYVKLHGALANRAHADRETADAVMRAIRAVDAKLVVLAIALGEQVRAAEAAGLPLRFEIFADRGYTEAGALVARSQPGALIHDPAFAAARAVRMVQHGAIETASGTYLPTPVHSICVHSDTAGAVDVAGAVRAALGAAGIAVRPFS